MTTKPGDDGRVDGVIEPVGLGLVREEQAKRGSEYYAASQQNASPPTGGLTQQGSAEP